MDENHGRVLVVDDDAMNRDMLSRRLQRHGLEVRTANDGIEALEVLGTDAFDVVILDIMMPRLNGIETLTRLREKLTPAQLPVIMATAKSETEDIVQALKRGASDYVTKPLDFPVVLARVRTQLALKRAVEQTVKLQDDLKKRNDELSAANAAISAANQRMRDELEDAAKLQKALLPKDLPRLERARFAWAFHPCVELGGDILNVFQLDANNVALYLLDVSGHGVPAALLATAVARTLMPNPLQSCPVRRIVAEPPGYCIAPPSEVVQDLNLRFPKSKATSQYFTMVYALLNPVTLEFRYVCAGHPPPIRITAAGESEKLNVMSPGVGVLNQATFQEASVRLQPGDRIYFFTDGVTEAMNQEKKEFEPERLAKILRAHTKSTLEESLEGVSAAVHAWCSPAAPDDDVSFLALEIASA